MHADGIAWQVDNTTTNPAGNWQILGIHDLLIQWTVVDDTAFIANTRIQPAAHLPDWERIGRGWARNVIQASPATGTKNGRAPICRRSPINPSK